MAVEMTEPITGAVFCLVTALLALAAVPRLRIMWAVYGAACLLFVLVIADTMLNDGGAEYGLYAAFVVLLVLAVMGLVVALMRGRRTADARIIEQPADLLQVVPAPATAASAYYDFKGDVHDVIDIEGIGPVYAEKLRAIGIETTARLCYEDPAALAQRMGVPAKTVRSWQAMAELAKVNGIGKQYAEALARAGVRGIDELKQRDAEAISAQVNGYLAALDNNVLGQNVTPRRITSWQIKARPMRRVRQRVPQT